MSTTAHQWSDYAAKHVVRQAEFMAAVAALPPSRQVRRANERAAKKALTRHPKASAPFYIAAVPVPVPTPKERRRAARKAQRDEAARPAAEKDAKAANSPTVESEAA